MASKNGPNMRQVENITDAIKLQMETGLFESVGHLLRSAEENTNSPILAHSDQDIAVLISIATPYYGENEEDK